ncbi:MAG: 4-hydroxy-tetrahydrodipicolinate synthase [Clostridiales bacterium]|nr:4-hydroxy-tetrahydrodipicolinate synthase [Clostridiales bacterium]
MDLRGIWIPLITPFKDNEVDLPSYKKLVEHYTAFDIAGLVPMGTTGESPTVSDLEYEQVLEATLEFKPATTPVLLGLGGNGTQKLKNRLYLAEKHRVDGILSVCPYYNRPSQEGIYRHFAEISYSTDKPIIIYNIPYRTGRVIENDTLRRLAELENVVAVKDASGDIYQTMELLLQPPPNFTILCGEDAFFYISLLHGGGGGILASAHINTQSFIDVFNLVQANNYQEALELWRPLAQMIPLLFAEPSPAPLKYLLHRDKLIASAQLRLPLVGITPQLAGILETTPALRVTP